jgi:hypothetical protein
MSPGQVEEIIQQVRSLPMDDQIEVAKAIGRMVWAERFRRVCERVEARLQQSGETITDEEIDELVRQVRRETPLSERSSILPS